MTDKFYLWYFEHYGDHDSCPRWKRLDDSAEYGVPWFEMINYHEEETIADSKESWGNEGENNKAAILENWTNELERKMEELKKELMSETLNHNHKKQ